MAGLAFTLYFVLLSPVWLPTIVPLRMPRLFRWVSAASGVFLVALAATLVIVWSMLGAPGLTTSIAFLFFAFVGSLHLVFAWRQPVAQDGS